MLSWNLDLLKVLSSTEIFFLSCFNCGKHTVLATKEASIVLVLGGSGIGNNLLMVNHD